MTRFLPDLGSPVHCVRFAARWICLFALLLLASFSQAQNTYRDVSLDTGGWVSGFAQHASGRLYGYGDIFGVYRSDDFGANWRFLQGSITEYVTFIQGLAVSPVDVNRVTFSTSGTLWTSTDGGENWTKRLGDLNASRTRGSSPVVYHPTQQDELWTAGPRKNLTGSLWRSIDHGASWTAVGGSAFANERAVTIHIFPSAPNEIWVGTGSVEGLSTVGGLWCSADSGVTWRKVWNNGGALTTYYGRPQVSCIARNAAKVSVFSTNTGVWHVTASDWSDPSTFVVAQGTFANQNIPNVTVLADGTFWTSEIGDQTWAPKVSTNGSTWTDRQITMTATYVPEWANAANIIAKNRVYGREMLVQDVNNPSRWLVTGGASAHLSEDNGLTWRYQPGGMSGIASYRVHFDRVNPGRAYLSSSDRGIFVLNDGGRSGKTVHCSNQTFDSLHTFHETMVSANGQTIVGAGVHQGQNGTVVIRSTDGGESWEKLNPQGMPDNYEGVTRSVMSLNDPADFLVLLGFTGRTGQPNNPGLYRTLNGGATFTKVGGTSFDGIDTGMRYHPENALRASNNSDARGVWRSTDGGTTWAKRVDPVGGQWIMAFAVDPTIEGRLWAANTGLRRSNDGGASWVTVGDFTATSSINAHGGRIAVLGQRSGDTFKKIYTSVDDGVTWQEKTNPENRMNWAQTVTVDPWRADQTWIAGSRSFQIINPPSPLDSVLTGTISGSDSSPNDTAANAFDAVTSTFFAPAANCGFAQLDLGSEASARVTAVRYFPRVGFEDRMNGGRFEASPDGVSWTTLASIAGTPSLDWQTLVIEDAAFYRYLRYAHPTGLADLAEVEFRGQMATAPTILNQPLPTFSGVVGQPLSYTVKASGNPAPTFAITGGSLPQGLILNPISGTIYGRPSERSIGDVIIQASNTSGSATATLPLNISFGPRISVTVPTPRYVQMENTTDTALVTLTNTGDAPLSWSARVPTVNANYALAGSGTAGSGVTYDWIDAVNGGTKLNFSSPDDSNAGPVTLPFSFTFYGTQFKTLRVCTNGWLGFTSTSTSLRPPISYPTTMSPGNLIAPFYWDLYLRSDSGVYYRTVDAETFVVSYVDLVTYAERSSTNPGRYSFQVVLKADGRILFHYQKVPAQEQDRVIGIQNANQTLGTTGSLPSPITEPLGRAYQFTPAVGWLAGMTPTNSSAAGGSLAAGESASLDATINTTGLAGGASYTANITFASNDPHNSTLAVPFNLLVEVSNTIASFRSTRGLAADGSQDLLTPARDGVANLLKYAFNMMGFGTGQAATLATPNAAVLSLNGTAGMPLVGVDPQGKLQITFIRRKASRNPGVTYEAQFASNAADNSWAVNASATESLVSIDTTFERVTITDDAIDSAQRFVRVRVTSTP
jgi:hypothetical protein